VLSKIPNIENRKIHINSEKEEEEEQQQQQS